MKFDTVEIHFKTKEKEERTVLIERGGKVKGIKFDSTQARQAKPPDGIVVLGGEVADFDGPGVCYDFGGALTCW